MNVTSFLDSLYKDTIFALFKTIASSPIVVIMLYFSDLVVITPYP